MITKKTIVEKLIGTQNIPVKKEAKAHSPANIALIKYWGKRDNELNLPVTSSLSLSLDKGTDTEIRVAEDDALTLNGKEADDTFTKRLFAFIDLFRTGDVKLSIKTRNDIPTAAGFASSSSGFAAITCALNDLFGWNLDKKSLSILARLGSGSAARSLYTGFVLWHRGNEADGLDSFAEPLQEMWPELKIDLIPISTEKKPIDSRQAMRITVETSSLYKAWPNQVANDLPLMLEAIKEHNFELLGTIAEQNALAMHATMIASSPTICYWHPQSLEWMQKIWALRKDGHSIYFTMDAGPNLKLLSLEKDKDLIRELKNDLPIVKYSATP